MSVNQRVEELNIFSKKHRDKALSSKLNISRSAFSSIVNGHTNPSYDTIVQILEHFPDLNLDWLFKGEGDMLKSKEEKAENPHTLRSAMKVMAGQQEIINDLQKQIDEMS